MRWPGRTPKIAEGPCQLAGTAVGIGVGIAVDAAFRQAGDILRIPVVAVGMTDQ